MSRRNMSDIIETYLKGFLKDQTQLEIKRSDIAEQFDCVPSQINYVINTRFTREHGYLVESKRGGGGYIRIVKVKLVDDSDEIDHMLKLIGDKLSYRNALNIINTLIRREVMTEREGRLLLAMIDKDVLRQITEFEQEVRAHLLKESLKELRIKDY